MLQIQKKDGTLESFDRRKVLNSLIRAQATPDQALKVAQDIENWLMSLGNTTINSGEIRVRIHEDLSKINPDAAHAYQVYKKAQSEAQK